MIEKDSSAGASRQAPPPQAERSKPRKAFILALVSNLGILVLTFLTGTINARLLGPSGRGELAAIQTVAATFSTLALLGLPTSVGFFSSRRPGEARAITATTFLLCLISAIPFMVAAYAFMPLFLHSQTPAVIGYARSYLWLLLLQPAMMIPMTSLQGLGEFEIWSLLRLLPNAAFVSAILWVWQAGAPKAGLVANAYIIILAIATPLAFGALSLKSQGSWAPSCTLVPPILRFGLPSAIMVPAGLINLHFDQILMAAWLPSSLLGLYAVSVSWSALISPIFSALGSTLFPTLAAAPDPDARRMLVSRSLRTAVLVVVILTGGLALVTPVMIPFFFGKAFLPAVSTALVLVAASAALNLSGVCGEMLRGLGAPRWPLYGQLAALPITVGLLAALLPRMSIMGAALASLLAYCTSFTVCAFGLRQCCAIPLGELLLPRRADVDHLLKHVRAMLVPRIRTFP